MGCECALTIYRQEVVNHDREISALMKRVREKDPEKHVLVEFVSREKLTLTL
ncbi:MAG: DUF5678 domain-containing protein [Thermoproteota archaeon]